MIRLTKILNEASGRDVVYGEESPSGIYLWVSYAPGSGTTHPLKDFKSVWIHNSPSSKFAQNKNKYLVKDLVDWSKTRKPILKTNKAAVYKVPVYKPVHSREGGPRTMSVWGGDVQPTSGVYIVISQEINDSYVIDFFKTFNEARNWIQSKTAD